MALNYKKTFMVIGNRLVQDHGFDPVPEFNAALEVRAYDDTTSVLRIITEFFNQNGTARDLLHELGGEWPMPDSDKHQEEDQCPAWFEDECCCDQIPDRAHLYYDRWLHTLKVLRQIDPKVADRIVQHWDASSDPRLYIASTTTDREGWKQLALTACDKSSLSHLSGAGPIHPDTGVASALGQIVLKLLKEKTVE